MSRDEILMVLNSAQQHLLQGVTETDLVARLEKCLAATIDLPDKVMEARTRSYLSGCYQLAGDRSLAREHAVRGLDLVRGARTDLEVDLLIQVARLVLAHDAATALRYTREALALFSKATDLALQIHNIAIHRSIVIVQAGMYMRMAVQEGTGRILGTIDFFCGTLKQRHLLMRRSSARFT